MRSKLPLLIFLTIAATGCADDTHPQSAISEHQDEFASTETGDTGGPIHRELTEFEQGNAFDEE